MKKAEFLALGLDEETAVKCEQASLEELKGFIPKSRFDEVNTENKQLKQDVSDRDTQLNDLKAKAVNDANLQAEITRLQEENTKNKEKFEADLAQTKLDNEIDKALMAANAKDLKIARAAFDLSKVKMEDGKLFGFSEQLKEIQESHAYLFGDEGKPSGTGGSLGGSNEPRGVGGGQALTYSQMIDALSRGEQL